MDARRIFPKKVFDFFCTAAAAGNGTNCSQSDGVDKRKKQSTAVHNFRPGLKNSRLPGRETNTPPHRLWTIGAVLRLSTL
jgi:hypothetical protein